MAGPRPGAAGHVAVASAVPGPAGALSLLTLCHGRELCPSGLSAGYPPRPTIWVSPLLGHRCYAPRHRGGAGDAGGSPPRCTPSSPTPPGSRPAPAAAHAAAAASSSFPTEEPEGSRRGLVSLCGDRGFVPLPPRRGSAAWRSPARGGAAEPVPPPGRGEGPRAFSLMQRYEYWGSFCSLFNGFECEKVVELGRGAARGEARPLCSGMLLQPWIYLAFGGLWGLSLLPSRCKGSLPFLPHAY